MVIGFFFFAKRYPSSILSNSVSIISGDAHYCFMQTMLAQRLFGEMIPTVRYDVVHYFEGEEFSGAKVGVCNRFEISRIYAQGGRLRTALRWRQCR